MHTVLIYGFGGFLYFKIVTALAFSGQGMNLLMSALMAVALAGAVLAVAPYYSALLGKQAARALAGVASATADAMFLPAAAQLGSLLLIGYLLAIGFDPTFARKIAKMFWLYGLICAAPLVVGTLLTWFAIETNTARVRNQSEQRSRVRMSGHDG